LYAVADEESVGCPHLGPLAPAVPLRVLNPGKDRYFSFFAATHFLTQACMPGTLPAHLASQAASDPCFAWGPAIAGVSDASATTPQTIKTRMCFLSNLKRYLRRLRPLWRSSKCPGGYFVLGSEVRSYDLPSGRPLIGSLHRLAPNQFPGSPLAIPPAKRLARENESAALPQPLGHRGTARRLHFGGAFARSARR
jgi:hypothetical protein